MPGPRPRSLLQATHPAVFKEALSISESDLEIRQLGTHSNRKVLWHCSACGHEWTATAAARARGGGCPECAKVTRARARAQAPPGSSLLDVKPIVAAEFVRNVTRPDMGPGDLRVSSQQRCEWRCATCGNRWEASVANRVAGRGCTSCANRRRSKSARRPTPRSGTAAQRAAFPVSELIANLTDATRGLEELRPGSTDRCLWRCSDCSHEWEATVVNRLLKGSGCPACDTRRLAENRATAREGTSLLARHPDIAAEFVSNESAPSRTPQTMRPGSNALCRWRCNRGHEWVTTVASRVAGAGCARCGARGQSRLELEVAQLLRAATGEYVEVDVPLTVGSRTWRIDIAMPALDFYVDLDPAFWHPDFARDQRKADALRGHNYVRLRHESLPRLHNVATFDVSDGSLDANDWAMALRLATADLGVSWKELSTDEVAQALSSAAKLWRQTLQGRPKRSALDVAPHLEEQFLRNETRPGLELAWLPPSARDKCWWRCQTCSLEWRTSIEVRANLGSGCPACGQARAARARSIAPAGGSLSELHPRVASEFVSCVRPDRTPADLRPSSNIVCLWKCFQCSQQYRASPAARVSGRACPRCAKSKGGDNRSRRDARGNSLAERFPALAAEFVDLEGRPDRIPEDIAPGSNLRARWQCRKCGHQWSAAVATRALGGNGCPACGRRRTANARSKPAPGTALANLHPRLAAELLENLTHPGRTAEQLKSGSHDRCRWGCGSGHEWVTTVKNRTRGGTGCPACHRIRMSRG
jgi:predicted  nucleic acid-binding Zn-ribbon protein